MQSSPIGRYRGSTVPNRSIRTHMQRYISIVYFEYIAARAAARVMLFTLAIYQRARPIENLTYHHSAMTNEIIADNF